MISKGIIFSIYSNEPQLYKFIERIIINIGKVSLYMHLQPKVDNTQGKAGSENEQCFVRYERGDENEIR